MQPKRLITILLVVALAIFGSLAASAAGAEEVSFETSIIMTPAEGELTDEGLILVSQGDTVNVSVTIDKNLGLGWGIFDIRYDDTLVPVTNEGELVYTIAPELAAMTNVTVTVTPDLAANKIVVDVQTEGWANMFYADDVIALSFTVAEDAPCGHADVWLAEPEGSFMNEAWECWGTDAGVLAVNDANATDYHGATANFHSYDEGTSNPANCTEGANVTYTCTNPECTSEPLVVVTSEPLGHDYSGEEGTVVTEANCAQGGYTTYTCQRAGCGYSYVGNETSKTTHDYELVKTVNADCTNYGYENWACKNCDSHYSAIVEAPLGHDFSGEGTDIEPPTCTSIGYTTYTCQNGCGYMYVANERPAAPHDYKGVDTPATCTTMGYTTYTCVCGNVVIADYTNTNGHTYTTVVTAPTCTTMGYTTYTCACGDVVIADYTNATGHTYTAVATPATCTTMGYTTYTCACSDKYVADYVDAKGHTVVEIAAVEPTYKAEGSTEGEKCSVCDTVLTAPETIAKKSPAWIIILSVSVVVVAGVVTAGIILWKKQLWIFKKK